ncbi:MAG TPA: apolipoprotein N-acyltransferase [Actinomycetota bacterium]
MPGLRLNPNRIRLPIAVLVVAIAGLALSLALPPAHLGWIAFLAPVPLLWLVRDARPRRGLLLGFVFGVASFGAILYWILQFGELAWGALVAVLAAYPAVFGMLAPAVRRRDRPVLSALGLASLWTVTEWVRGMWPVGGFTWGQLGTTQTANPFLLPLASVAGVWGISFVVLLAAALIIEAGSRARARPAAAAGLAVLAAISVLAPGFIGIPTPNGRILRIAAIQVDVREARGLPPLQEDQVVAELNLQLHQRLQAEPPDLAVWGESSLDPGANLPEFRPRVVRTIKEVGVPTLAGAVVETAGGRFYNESLLFDGAGRIVGEYRKVHLVPFGEYVPFRSALSWVSALRQIPYDETPGDSIHPLRIDGITFGNVICFENSFPSLDRTLVDRGAGFLVVTTNNASYGFTAASRQHLIMSQLRAVENGRWVVHAAVSGISAFIDPQGHVVAETRLFEPAILRHAVQASSARTLYTRLGDWLPWLSLLIVLGLLLVPRRRPGPERDPGPLPDRPRTLVILPTYNERDTIVRVLRGLLALPEDVNVLVVDDGSPDGTADLVRDLARSEPRVRLVERPAKAGLASAYLVGFRRALQEGYDLAVEMDSDLSHDPTELPSLLAGEGANHLTIGSRYVPGGVVTNWSRARVALSKAGNLYARLALGFPFRDATSGYRAYRRDLLEHLVAGDVRSDGYGFQIELALRAWYDGYRVGEAPISFREREHGTSKISRRIVAEALWLVTVWGVRSRLGLPPLRVTGRP